MTVGKLRGLGMEAMDEEEIDAFLHTQGVGILALPTGDVPYVLPMSFGYVGEDAIYFTFLVGEESRKSDLVEDGLRARFLVYAAGSMFTWQSVMVTGTLSTVPDDEWEESDGLMENAWRPDLLQGAIGEDDICCYRLEIEEATGYKHTGLPEGFEP
jgi:nitroimidazol reductase NimA-like FMN-containing flavoprotein (pyridoxamine 5'-phosphate oxidase superfamily)